jgi:hypothetical protein
MTQSYHRLQSCLMAFTAWLFALKCQESLDSEHVLIVGCSQRARRQQDNRGLQIKNGFAASLNQNAELRFNESLF